MTPITFEILDMFAWVQLMAGGPAFLRPLEELTTRLCYVNFVGKPVLEYSRRLGLDTALPEDFVFQQCRPVYDGIQVRYSQLQVW